MLKIKRKIKDNKIWASIMDSGEGFNITGYLLDCRSVFTLFILLTLIKSRLSPKSKEAVNCIVNSIGKANVRLNKRRKNFIS